MAQRRSLSTLLSCQLNKKQKKTTHQRCIGHQFPSANGTLGMPKARAEITRVRRRSQVLDLRTRQHLINNQVRLAELKGQAKNCTKLFKLRIHQPEAKSL